MNLKKEYICIITCAAIVAAGFGIGYLSARVHRNDIPPEPISQKEYTQEQNNTQASQSDYDEAAASSDPQFYYLLINEDNFLNLYEINADTKVLIKKLSFQPEYLPFEDRQKLLEGIKLSAKEDGYALIEDFTS